MLSYSAKAEYPVRRGLSVLSLTSLEYWITRLARVMTVARRNAQVSETTARKWIGSRRSFDRLTSGILL